jgi:hypothetical protein
MNIRRIAGKREKEKQGVFRYIFCMDYIDDRQKSSLSFFSILRVYMRIQIDIELDQKKEQEIN